jgi:uncharacterized membrane protein YjdF
MLLLKSRIFWGQAAAILMVSGIHFVASARNLYDLIWWIDIPQHFLGGIWVGLACLWLIAVARRPIPALLTIFLMVFAVGIAWEIYEYAFGISGGPMYVYDTAKDLLMDCLGALTAYAIGTRFLLKKEI